MRRLGLFLVAILAPAAAAALVGTVRTSTVSCGTTATEVAAPQGTDRAVLLCVPDTAVGSVYVGDSSVTTSNGIQVAPGKCYSSGDKLRGSGSSPARLYCIADVATTVRVQEHR